MSKTKVSIVDVANVAGVSYQTVSRVINNSDSVKEETRQKVLDAIEQLGYYPSQTARSLKTKHSHMIGIIASQTQYSGPLNTIAAIESIARKYDLYVTVTTVDETTLDHDQYVDLVSHFRPLGVEALVIVAPTQAMVSMALDDDTAIPRVIITAPFGQDDEKQNTWKRDLVRIVGIDPTVPIHALAADCTRAGVRHAYIFSGPLQWRDAFTRQKVWEESAQSANLPYQIIDVHDWTAQCGYEAMKDLIKSKGKNSLNSAAVLCANDLIAMGCYRAIYEAGLRIPDDVTVIGYDAMPGTDILMPPLTTMDPNYFEVGELAMREVLDLLDYREFDAKQRRQYSSVGHMSVVEPRLIQRSSTRNE